MDLVAPLRPMLGDLHLNGLGYLGDLISKSPQVILLGSQSEMRITELVGAAVMEVQGGKLWSPHVFITWAGGSSVLLGGQACGQANW